MVHLKEIDTQRFMKVLKEKLEARVSDVSKQHIYLSNFSDVFRGSQKNSGRNGLIRTM